MKIDIACPVYSGITGTPEQAMRKAMENISSTGVVLQAHGLAGGLHVTSECGWVDLARAELLSLFLRGNADALLFHDQDIVAPGKTILSLIEASKTIAKDSIVFCSYRMRQSPHSWIFDHHEEKTIRIVPGMTHKVPSVLMRASSGPLGFALLPRSVIGKLVYCYPELRTFSSENGKELFELFLPMVREHHHLGEDAAFFHRCGAAGIRVECLADAELNHGGVTGRLSDYI